MIGEWAALRGPPLQFVQALKNQFGFTLYELVLVMSLIGIMTFVAIPAITNVQGISMDQASAKVESDIRYAQNLAMTTGDEYGFRTTGGANTAYEVYDVSTGTAVESPYDHLPMTEDLLNDYGGVSMTGAVNITFDERGYPTIVTGTNEVTMQNSGGETQVITIGDNGLIDAD